MSYFFYKYSLEREDSIDLSMSYLI